MEEMLGIPTPVLTQLSNPITSARYKTGCTTTVANHVGVNIPLQVVS